MKKHLFTCFLASLCLYGSTTIAQVADSPPETDLVDYSGIPGQEGASPSARLGALIYGELINPDSLAPLSLELRQGLLAKGLFLSDSAFQVPLSHGTFFDGVLDPRVQKFQVHIPLQEDFALIELKIGQRSILKDFLIYPADSIKVGIDLQEFKVVFAGPQKMWFEAQYAIKRAQASAQFEGPRVLLEINREALLDQQDYRQQVASQESVFGSRIAIYEFGKDGLDHELSLLMDSTLSSIPGWAALQEFRSSLPQERFHMLQSQLTAAYYAEHLATFKQYHHGMPLALGDTTAATHARELIPMILEKLDLELTESLTKGLNSGTIDLAREWIYSKKILSPEPLEQLIADKYMSPIREKLLLSILLKKVETANIPPSEWQRYAEHLIASPLEKEFNTLKSTFETNTYLSPAKFYSLAGNELSLKDFFGKPVLLYFYYSGCTHSANYFRNYLQPFYQNQGMDLGLQVIAVSVDLDTDLWKSQLSTYSSTAIINLNLPGDEASDWLSHYRITGFPRSMLLDREGKVLSYTLDGRDFSEYSANIVSLLDSVQPVENQMNH
ncbi:TlpA disulfide reductase family protein [Algoriphagus aquimarinus]|uniref:TlpA family protein disulfide reductase n=1 Tax=Algoriphagus aquimarinus TaxID=237018 RepID=UPI0030D9A8B6